MSSPAIIAAEIINTAGLASSSSNLFVSYEKDTPDTCVTVYDTVGGQPETTIDGENAGYMGNIQVRVRMAPSATDYPDGWTLAENLKALLDNALGSTTEWKYEIWCMSDIISLGRDSKNRPRFTVNFTVKRWSI